MNRPAPAPGILSDTDLASHPCSLAPGLFTGRVVVISGGGSGIGRATAWLAARLGAHVVLCGRTQEKLARAVAGLRQAGLRAESAAVDIRQRAAVDQLFADLCDRLGRVDLLVNSAGGQFPQAALDFSEKGWRAVIDTNLNGTFNMMQSVARQWRTAGQPGSIVSIVVSARGLHQVAHTCAARAGVGALTEAVAVEWAPLNIRVNCIAPGAIVSEGWAAYPADISAPLRAGQPAAPRGQSPGKSPRRRCSSAAPAGRSSPARPCT